MIQIPRHKNYSSPFKEIHAEPIQIKNHGLPPMSQTPLAGSAPEGAA